MNIVLFGGSGYIGEKALRFLYGHELTIADLYPPKDLSDSTAYSYIHCDIIDGKTVNEIVSNADVVFNFAASSSLEGCNSNPCHAVKVNLVGHMNILQACAENKAKKYIFASSVYALSNYGGVYGITKRAGEELLLHYHKAYDLQFAGIRYGTIYGPESGQGNSLYDLIRQAVTDRRIEYSGSGQELRDFIHIEDAARMTAEMVSDKYRNEFFTVTGYHSYKMCDIIELICEILDEDIEIIYKNKGSKYHYSRTPANFRNIVAKKIVSDRYVDIHQGLLDTINAIHGEVYDEKD